MEAEACDFFSDLTKGNSGGAFPDLGDLDVAKCTDELSFTITAFCGNIVYP
jgi:hypothetical protein